MSSLLDVRSDRRSRSKSPGGDRDRSRSRDTRSRDVPDRDEYTSRRSNKPYPKEGSNSDDDRRYKERKSSKKYYDESDEEEDRRKSKSSSRRHVDDSDEGDKYRSYKSGSSRTIDTEAEDRWRYERSNKKSDSDSDRQRDRRERSSRSKYDASRDESDSDARRRYKDSHSNGGYGGPPGSYPEVRPGTARHSSYVATDPRYSAPGAFPGDAPPTAQRMHSYSGSSNAQYANVDQFRYADPRQITSSRKPEQERARAAEYEQSRAAEQERSRAAEYERSRPKDSRHRDSDSDSDDRRDRDHRHTSKYESHETRTSKYEPRETRTSKHEDDRYETRTSKHENDRFETREPKSKKYYDGDEDDKYDRKDTRDKKYHSDKYGSTHDDMTKKMSTLAVGSAALGAVTLGVAHHNSHAGGKPPASPLLEAYRGTYQTISPMPSALVLADHKDDSDLSDLDLELDDDLHGPDAALKRKIRKLEKEKEKYTKGSKGSVTITETEEIRSRHLSNIDTNLNVEVREPGSIKRDRSPSMSILSPGGGHSKRKSVSFYDPTEDAKRIAAGLSSTRSAPDPRPLVQILPRLSTDDLIALKSEYKNHAKVSGQGINMAKHIKMRVTGNLGKACYATALGRWESEAYWANSWYQGGASRRELLIESLMGRSNSDIREIKNCFKDKKYNDDLEKCIKTELKADKFRVAILLALEERRTPESSPLDIKLVKQDAVQLAEALESAGGETAMIKIVVLRSDAHLREVLRLFERTYGVNFARQMISKSRNLVGETLAHVLNGALNRPMRDALLLHQAINETAPGKERTELLISRLVRLHWEPRHLEKVKAVFKERYRMSVEDAVKREVWSQMKTQEGRLAADFCFELLMSSSPY